jgi:hypothetical protein
MFGTGQVCVTQHGMEKSASGLFELRQCSRLFRTSFCVLAVAEVRASSRFQYIKNFKYESDHLDQRLALR